MTGNWLRLGPASIRIGSRHLAASGFPRLQIGGLSIWSRCSDGSLLLASYHPRNSPTWHLSLSVVNGSGRKLFDRAERRECQWADYLALPFNRALCWMRQDYHRRTIAAVS